MAFTLENHGYSPEEIRKRSREALAKVRLTGLEKREVSTLSGGQRQRLVVAAVLAEEPEVLIFDEPTSAMDPEGISEFYEMVGRLNRENGLTVVVAEHHLEAVLPYANRFALLDRGHLLSEGTPEQVMKFMMNHQVYANAIPDIYKAQLVLEEEGCRFDEPFLSVSKDRASVARAVKGE